MCQTAKWQALAHLLLLLLLMANDVAPHGPLRCKLRRGNQQRQQQQKRRPEQQHLVTA
jgi:hypothetical protein